MEYVVAYDLSGVNRLDRYLLICRDEREVGNDNITGRIGGIVIHRAAGEEEVAAGDVLALEYSLNLKGLTGFDSNVFIYSGLSVSFKLNVQALLGVHC